jgi:zinc transport system substrate-binding protein
MQVFKSPSDKIAFIAASVLIVVAAAFVFLHKSPVAPAETGITKLKIAATVIPVESLLKEIGGDKVEITLMVPEGQSPHTFEPSPDVISGISEAESVFTIGVIDDWVSPLTRTFGTPEFNVGSGIALKPFKETFTVGEEELPEGGEGYDPHYWLSVANGKIVAKNIAGELSRIDGASADYYAENLRSFLDRADIADAKIRETLSELENRKIITFHDAWGYFADDYGLEVVAVYQPSPGKDPSPQDVKSLIDKARDEGIKTFFSEILMSSAPLKAIGESEGIKVVPLNPLETRGDYLETLVKDAETIRDALK